MIEESRHWDYIMADFSIIANALVSGDVTLSAKTAPTDTSSVDLVDYHCWLLADWLCALPLQLVPLLPVLTMDILVIHYIHYFTMKYIQPIY